MSHLIAPSAQTIAPAPAPALRNSRRIVPSRLFAAALTCVVVSFAFLAASTAVRNSDFWRHLAAGRLLAHGAYRFGVDPFSYASADAYWVNHAWLYDLGLYAAYQTLGGAALVVLKALAIGVLAWRLLQIRRPGTSVLLPAACVLLALLVMSPRLPLQPGSLSLLLLGICLEILWRLHGGAANGSASSIRRYALLLPLFVLWANLDEWFVLGPALAALFWLGERLGPAEQRRTPGWLAPAAIVVCLLNPHFYRVFTLPHELSPALWDSELRLDPRFRMWFLSPWQFREYLLPNAGLNAAGIAYFILFGLGVASFIARRRHLLDWRLPVWGAFALLGAWQVQAIPFFAVVAGPITALNLQDAWAVRRTGEALGRLEFLFVRGAHFALFASGLILVALAWPGWLHGAQHEQQRVAWKVEADSTLKRVAHALHEWRQEGLVTDADRVFPFHPDMANYCAWFAPGEKSFLDDRTAFLSGALSEYESVCRALASSRAGSESREDWRGVLRTHGITILVLYDPDEQRLFPAFRRLTQTPDEWDLLRIDGRALVFGWKEGRQGASFDGLRLDPHGFAFGPENNESDLAPAPEHGTRRGPHRHEWWDDFLEAAPAAGWESDAATMYLRYFEDRTRQEQRPKPRALAVYAAGVAGLAAAGPPVAAEQAVYRLVDAVPFVPGLGTRDPELLLLAIRAARSALAANPDDANAWLRLGQAYLTLHGTTAERPTIIALPLVDLLRHVQIATALECALVLDPDLEAAHEALSVLYGDRTYLDAALEHRRHAMRLSRRGPRPGETTKHFEDRMKDETQAVRRLELLVQDRRNEYGVSARAMSGDPLGRAQLALNLGLARLALDEVLLQAPVQSFGGEGARLELELLLQLGRADKVREMLDDTETAENKDKLELSRVPAPSHPGYVRYYRLSAYEWLRFQQAAATGDYGAAALAMEELQRPMAVNGRRAVTQMRRAIPFALACEVGLAARPEHLVLRSLMQNERGQFARALTEVSFLASQRADLYVLAALLHAERGASTAALQALDAAAAADAERGAASDFAAAPLAGSYRDQYQAVARQAGKK
jgi:tetratricopeptide (TPR) repeat protein